MTASLSRLSIESDVLELTTFTQALERLRNESESWRQLYLQAQPYPHLVIDDLFAPELLERWTPVPMPLWAKAGTPLLWASKRKQDTKFLFAR